MTSSIWGFTSGLTICGVLQDNIEVQELHVVSLIKSSFSQFVQSWQKWQFCIQRF